MELQDLKGGASTISHPGPWVVKTKQQNSQNWILVFNLVLPSDHFTPELVLVTGLHVHKAQGPGALQAGPGEISLAAMEGKEAV